MGLLTKFLYFHRVYIFHLKKKKLIIFKNALLIFYSISWASCVSYLCLNRYVGPDDLQRCLPTLTILLFHELLVINGLNFLYTSFLLGKVCLCVLLWVFFLFAFFNLLFVSNRSYTLRGH